MVRDGAPFGIYYIITANQVNDLSGKLYNVMTQRLTFTLADTSAYIDIVGRGALSLSNVPGRGLINVEGQPLEFHVGVPVMENEKTPSPGWPSAWSASGRRWAASGRRPKSRGASASSICSACWKARKIESYRRPEHRREVARQHAAREPGVAEGAAGTHQQQRSAHR